ncbi:hypothetical protein EYF80_057911 [Liparis tanakae]|uniref:Uncharacterized protein n=1 Tax=Liparis tanakae TaxID=230148 RepID=A0A4Z2ETH3_9TELE|nr:hypothetical protein EYF80_057911 [Liparis tanakae]
MWHPLTFEVPASGSEHEKEPDQGDLPFSIPKVSAGLLSSSEFIEPPEGSPENLVEESDEAHLAAVF